MDMCFHRQEPWKRHEVLVNWRFFGCHAVTLHACVAWAALNRFQGATRGYLLRNGLEITCTPVAAGTLRSLRVATAIYHFSGGTKSAIDLVHTVGNSLLISVIAFHSSHKFQLPRSLPPTAYLLPFSANFLFCVLFPTPTQLNSTQLPLYSDNPCHLELAGSFTTCIYE